MKYLSVCSGIESVSVAWEPLGFECLGVSEIDPFRSAVLEHHYPEVKNYGDFTKIQKDDLPRRPDILVGGTPCATFSIAGLREGIESDRGNLALEFILLAQRVKPKWLLWENVPGILSSNGGKDLGTFLGGLAELGYGFAYRVLDSQYIRTQRFPRAVPQRRRRIFVVGYLGDWKNPAKVLLDETALRGDPPPSRKEKKGSARKSTHRLARSDQYIQDEVAGTVTARDYKSATDLVIDEPIMIHGNHTRVNGDGFQYDGASYTLLASEIPSVMTPNPVVIRDSQTGANGKPWNDEDVSWSLTAHDRYSVALADGMKPRNSIVRRLTPLECERLQGFPDNYTEVPYRGQPKEKAPVSKRYEACGRAMAINVMEWLGQRLLKVENNEI